MLSFKQSALKKIVATFLLLATLIPLFIVNVSANDSVFLETLIDTGASELRIAGESAHENDVVQHVRCLLTFPRR